MGLIACEKFRKNKMCLNQIWNFYYEFFYISHYALKNVKVWITFVTNKWNEKITDVCYIPSTKAENISKDLRVLLTRPEAFSDLSGKENYFRFQLVYAKQNIFCSKQPYNVKTTPRRYNVMLTYNK